MKKREDTTAIERCPICATGELASFEEQNELQYKGKTLSLMMEYAVCQHCGEEMILPDQIKRNDCRVRDAWRKVEKNVNLDELAKPTGV